MFAEEIFGPSKDWECYCGKYKKIRYKGIVCDKCGVEVTHSLVRRERMGHIELAASVTHIWFLRGVPSKVGTTLDMSVQALEKVIYFAAFIVTDVNEELRVNTLEQLRVEYKTKRKAIETEYERELARKDAEAPVSALASAVPAPEIAEKAVEKKKKGKKDKPIGGPLEELHEAKERKLKELESDFSTAEKELAT